MSNENGYIIPIGIDAGQAVAGLDNLAASLAQLKKESAESRAAINDMSKRATDGATQANAALKNEVNSANLLKKSILELKASMDTYNESALRSLDPKKINEYRQKASELKTEIDRLSNIGKKGFDELGNKIKQVSSYQEQLTNRLKLYQAALAKQPNSDFGAKNIVALNKKIEATQGELSRLNNAGKKGFDELGNAVVETTKKTGNFATKAFSSLRLIANILPGVGLAGLIGFAVGPIIDYIAQLDIFKEKAADIAKKNAIGSNEFKEAVSGVESLKTSISEYHSGIITGKQLVDRYNETIGKTAGQLKTVAEVEDFYNSKAGDFVEAMLLKAKAAAQLEIATKKVQEAQERAVGGPSFKDHMIGVGKSIVDQFNTVPKAVKNSMFLIATGGASLFRDIDGMRKHAKQAQKDAVKDLEKEAKDGFVLFDKLQKDADKFNKKHGFKFDDKNDDKANQAAAENAERERLNKRLQLEKEYHKLLVDLMEEGRAKEMENINLTFEDRKKDIENQFNALNAKKALSKEEIELKEGLLTALENQQKAKLLLIDTKFNDLQKKQELDTQKELANLMKDGLERSLAILKSGYDAKINEIDVKGNELKRKKEALEKELDKEKDPVKMEALALDIVDTNRDLEDNAKVRAAITAKYLEDEAKTKRDFALKEIDQKEALDKATTELFKVDGANKAKLQRLKEKDLLLITIQAAEERIKILEKLDDKESKTKVAQLQKAINDARAKLKENDENSDPGNDLFAFLGLEGDWPKALEKISQFGQQAASLFGAMADGIKQQIDAKQEQIDAFTSQIDELESQLDREKELQEKGFANNVALKEQEIAAAKSQREKLLKEQEEMQKKQQALQKAQLIADSIGQVSSLVSASASIFENSTKYLGPIGVPIAIASIAAMFGAFAIAKVNAFKAINGGGKKFAQGGEFVLDGPSHAGGGLGVYDERSGKRVAEVEGGEGFFAINKRSTQKHKGLLSAINNDDFKDFAAFGNSLDQILNDSGIMFPHEEMQKVVVVAQNNVQADTEYKAAMVEIAKNTGLLKDIADSNKHISDSNKKLLEIEQDKPEVTDMGDYLLIKEGNRVTRKWKNTNL